ncbi:HAMP domain-containing histidine kinase [Cellulophaga sp. E16_2]|uniref:sensor histidine kinase n=1 Tax=unclassified Cellulophaga TaxID=2634405 RepID=UPI0013FD5E7E|nr:MULTISPECIES: HAMP domain-containing sensor histidine kinase [unclassified Cellulophaga]MBO0590737.1 HAMP domain-containing histidine kinase [Cellulophaga sp. E16_2]
MTTTGEKLKERIKELTCLYEVTSIIVNCDYNQLETTLEAIVDCLKKAMRYDKDAFVFLSCDQYDITSHSILPALVSLKSPIKVFNTIDGHIIVGYPESDYTPKDFLKEELTLLNNVSLAIGNLLEKKQIRENEITIKRQVERADRLNILGEITAGIAHELNTPLANILGFAELLKTNLTEEKAIRDLDKIVDSAIFSREVVKKLMFFTCEMPQQMGILTINPIILNVLNLLDLTFKKNKVKHSLSINKDAIQLRADSVQLTQVLFNLIMNAIYFSPPHSTISIKVEELVHHIKISISDEGSGISKTNEEKIFQPFFTTKPVGEGSGLGLSVVHGIVKSHKGQIIYSPNTPKGATFIVDFPKL